MPNQITSVIEAAGIDKIFEAAELVNQKNWLPKWKRRNQKIVRVSMLLFILHLLATDISLLVVFLCPSVRPYLFIDYYTTFPCFLLSVFFIGLSFKRVLRAFYLAIPYYIVCTLLVSYTFVAMGCDCASGTENLSYLIGHGIFTWAFTLMYIHKKFFRTTLGNAGGLLTVFFVFWSSLLFLSFMIEGMN